MLKKLLHLKAFGVKYTNQNMIKMQKPRALNQNCMLCSLYKTRSHIVQDIKDNQDVMIIQFMPTLKEDLTNTIQTNEILSLFGISRAYFTYILKCHGLASTNNIKICKSHVIDEILSLKPKLIIVLGKETFEALGFKNFKILRGVVLNFYQAKLISSYNLSYVKSNPNLKDLFSKDIDTIKYYLKGI